MQIIINDLFNGPNKFTYSNQVEEYLGELLSKHLRALYKPQEKGYNPKFDFMLNKKKVELKITGSCNPNIEFANGELEPSGLLLTESDYYVVLSPGGSKGRFVGKFRIFDTKDLKKLMLFNLLEKTVKVYEKNANGPGSVTFAIDPKYVRSEKWLGDCELIFKDEEIIGFDMDTFTPAHNITSLMQYFLG